MTTSNQNLQLDHRAALLTASLIRYLELPNSQRKGDLTAGFKDYSDEYMRLHYAKRVPEMIVDENGVETEVYENFDGTMDRIDNLRLVLDATVEQILGGDS